MEKLNKEKIKKKIKNGYITKNVYEKISEIRNAMKVSRWISSGMKPPPPQVVKRERIIKEGREANAKIFVETGTYMGNTVEYVENNFEKIYTIEVDSDLHMFNENYSGKEGKIEFILGDSKDKLKKVLKKIGNKKAIFWLDAHCSEGITSMGESYTPILDEIRDIERHSSEGTILIDDLRLFKSDKRYPSIEDIHASTEKNVEEKEILDMIIIK